MMQIAVFAAIPQEYRPFQKGLGQWRRLAKRPYAIWLHRFHDKHVLLVETGMGNQLAAQAGEHLISKSPLDLLMSVGFAGSLATDLRLGQLVWSQELAVCNTLRGACPLLRYRSGQATHLAVFREIHGIRSARFLTLEQPQPKTTLIHHLDDLPTVIDMESEPLAALAQRHGIPFLGLRAISDELNDEIDWDLGSILDESGKVRITKVMSTVFKRPGLVASFHGLWRNSLIAGRHLAQTLTALLMLPERDLWALSRDLHLLPVPETTAEPLGIGESSSDDGQRPPA
ncbi:MAG TPA: hypothetical protein DCE18_13960 [Syntrophobacteraceae bacterium]|jgi:adenosylhomocysteine nucleosidase|nr:hypothetical protein [Syntrophobacteraceae bacterium]